MAVEMHPGEDARRTLVYEESQRALDQQQDALDNLHTRAGVLVAAAAIVSSFLGGQALRSGGDFTTWSLLAVAALAVVGVAAILVLWPTGGWVFSNRVDTLLSGYIEDGEPATIDEMHIRIAEFNQKHLDENRTKLAKRYLCFQVACGALAFEVIFWLIDLGARSS